MADETVAAGPSLVKRLAAEFIGTALLLAVIIGSGAQAQALQIANKTPFADLGIQVLVVAVCTGPVLTALIWLFGPISGASFNPVVSIIGGLLDPKNAKWGEIGAYIVAQLAGAFVGAVVTQLMFSLPAVEISTTARNTPGLWIGEVVATFGLMLVVFVTGRAGNGQYVPLAVGFYILGAIFFTSSTSFANPAVTFGRIFTDSLCGIAPSSVLMFILMQLIGGGLAFAVIKFLTPDPK
ncbi:hypothetical protein HMPREF1531_00735 [Propionibacterium sp. oral taxon 192 str. F0372]|uniref:MIP/aquaporin family protein n=1 Tax=Propionibacterium sp. oral taxon 192 TaxID=671222 RepID=UPI000354385D|nr:MIP/aquaporin family protein [Propionibacterium sp. oral taxon 192]EPH06087.1 hypothetical protein HMPREF1531_00735 [Propionibacterium sp. oral taxon 192 str. F0372]